MATTHKTQEWIEYYEDNVDELSKKTLETYFNDYNRFRSEMRGKHNIYNLSQKEIMDIVSKTEWAKLNLLNIAIVILQNKNKEVSLLLKYRKNIQEGREDQQAAKNEAQIKKANASYDDLMRALDEATGKDYILFYLLINLNTRNNDLIMKLITNKQKDLLNEEDNFMIVSPSKSRFVRNDYKTNKSFGVKIDKIRDEKFQKMINKELLEGNEYLFVNNKKKPYKQTEMGKFIKSRFAFYLDVKSADPKEEVKTNLSQAVIYKIISEYAREFGGDKMKKDIADARGHSLDTQAKYYSTIDVSNKKAEESDDDEELNEMIQV